MREQIGGRVLTIAAVLSGLTMGPAAVLAGHFDFVPNVVNGKVATAGFNDEENVSVDNLVVGGYDFGENVDDPYNVGDPGFNTLGASGFPATSQLRFLPLAVADASLRYWDGVGEPVFAPAPAGVSVTIAGSPTRSVTYRAGGVSVAPSTVDSLLIGTFTNNGALHVHVTSSIFFNDDQIPDSVPVGAYLLSFQLTNPGTGIQASDPLFLVYNNGLTEELHDAAIDAVAGSYALNVIPEPTALAMLTPALLLLGRGRRQ